jgi:hypothetical protein
VALLSGGGRRLRNIVERLAEKAEQGDMAIQQIGDRLDGKPTQAVERGSVTVEALSDAELYAIIRDGNQRNEPALICGPVPSPK